MLFGVFVNLVILVGFGFGIVVVVMIVFGVIYFVLIFLLLSCLVDGLDGVVVCVIGKIDFGGYLDIVCDFLFYGLVLMVFVWMEF